MNINLNDAAAILTMVGGSLGAFFGAYVKLKGNSTLKPQTNDSTHVDQPKHSCAFSIDSSDSRFQRLENVMREEARDIRSKLDMALMLKGLKND